MSVEEAADYYYSKLFHDYYYKDCPLDEKEIEEEKWYKDFVARCDICPDRSWCGYKEDYDKGLWDFDKLYKECLEVFELGFITEDMYKMLSLDSSKGVGINEVRKR